MKLIIAGSRHLDVPNDFIYWCVANAFIGEISEVISGTAMGIDRAGEEYAYVQNLKLSKFPADWDKFGKSAGHKRNKQMAEYGDILLLIWDGESKGSANMKSEMMKLNKPIREYIIKRVFNE